MITIFLENKNFKNATIYSKIKICSIVLQLNSDGSPISIGPAVEFVRLDFCRAEDLTPGNVTLCNLGADQFILGDMGAWDSFDFTALADIEIELISSM